MDELPDSLIDKMYQEMVLDKPQTAESTQDDQKTNKKSKTSKAKTKAKAKYIAPTTSQPSSKPGVKYAARTAAPKITDVGKKATSRLFDYEAGHASHKEFVDKQEVKHEELRQQSIQQLRKAAAEKKKERNDLVRASLSRERVTRLRGQSALEKQAAVASLQAEERLRKEVAHAGQSMMKVVNLAFGQ